METLEKSKFLKKIFKSIIECSPNTYGKVTVINNEPSSILLIEIYGEGYLDRITLTLRAISMIQKSGGIAAFIDADNILDVKNVKRIGVDVENLIISKSENTEQAVEVAENLIACGAIDIVVVRSISELNIKVNPTK